VDAELRKEVPVARRDAGRGRPVRLLGRTVLRRLLRRHRHLFQPARDRAHLLRRGAPRHRQSLAHQHPAPGLEVRSRLRADQGRRAVAGHHHLRHRSICVLGTAAGGDLAQARHGLPRAHRLQRGHLRVRHAGGYPAGADGRLGARLPVRHLEPPRLGVEHRVPVPAFPLQPGAHAGHHLLLHHHLCLVAARLAGAGGAQPGQRRAGEDRGAREHLLPRRHRLFDRHARHPPPRPLLGAERGLLERGVHRHQRPLLDPWLAGVVGLVAQPAHLEL
ncbi:MAG: Photosynthetic reaction center L subunit, partial [uncultured Acetobacteraceae bacterium]